MSQKNLSAFNLAQLTNALLLDPDVYFPGSDVDKKQLQEDLAALLLKHTDGTMVSAPGYDMVTVDVPDYGVWQLMPDSYTETSPGQTVAIDSPQPNMTREMAQSELNGLIARGALAAEQTVDFTMEMIDWRLMDGEPIELPSDTIPFKLHGCLGNQISLEVSDINGDPAMGLFVEVDQGIPALHIDMGGDCLLHLRFTEDGLLIEPEHEMRQPEPHEMGRHAHANEAGRALLIELPEYDKPDYTSHPPVNASTGP